MSEPKVSFKCDWPSITEDGKIPTAEFLDACNVIIQVFGMLGKMFIPVKRDVQGNVNKLRLKFNGDPDKYSTLHEMIESEVPEAESSSAIDSLKWLKRGLHFMYLLLNNVIEGYESGVAENSLVEPCLQAYEISLKSYHNWAVQKVVVTCIQSRICPKRNELLKSISHGSEETEVIQELKQFVNGLGVNLKCIFDLYVNNGLDMVEDL